MGEPIKAINTILVAIDFSEHSKRAVQYAVKLAKDVSAKLVFVNVINQRDVDVMKMVSQRVADFSMEKYLNEEKEDREVLFNELIGPLTSEALEIDFSIRIGVPYKELIQAIEKSGADLLVMATKGRSNLADTIVGSCAQKMFRHSPIPLVSIRG